MKSKKELEDAANKFVKDNKMFGPVSFIKGESFKAGALYWRERSDRELGEWRELAECRQFTIVNQQSEIAKLKAEIERLKALPHKPTNSQPNNQGE